jgi:hypothetical protein
MLHVAQAQLAERGASICSGNAAELATYVVEKGKPLVTVVRSPDQLSPCPVRTHSATCRGTAPWIRTLGDATISDHDRRTG